MMRPAKPAVRRFGRVAGVLLAATQLSACSVQRMALGSVSELFSSGGSVFEQDSDPALVAEALPFGLKLLEALLQDQPDDTRLLLATAQGFLLYGYAFVWLPSEQLRFSDLERAGELRERARALYLRAHGYGERALVLTPQPFAAEDVPVLYWNAAALGLLIAASKDRPQWLARLPEVEQALDRALALDEAWNGGVLHELAITLAGTRPGGMDLAAVEEHYQHAVRLSQGSRASLYVTYAEAVAVRTQDRDQYVALLKRALAVDLDANPDGRLMNVVAQQRARWLLDHVDDFIL
jgi:hypothetical protein